MKPSELLQKGYDNNTVHTYGNGEVRIPPDTELLLTIDGEEIELFDQWAPALLELGSKNWSNSESKALVTVGEITYDDKIEFYLNGKRISAIDAVGYIGVGISTTLKEALKEDVEL